MRALVRGAHCGWADGTSQRERAHTSPVRTGPPVRLRVFPPAAHCSMRAECREKKGGGWGASALFALEPPRPRPSPAHRPQRGHRADIPKGARVGEGVFLERGGHYVRVHGSPPLDCSMIIAQASSLWLEWSLTLTACTE